MSRPVTPAPAHQESAHSYLEPGTTKAGSRPASALGASPGVEAVDHTHGTPHDTSTLSHPADAHEGTTVGNDSPGLQRSDSHLSQSQTYVPSRGGTLKKKASLKKSGSIRRSASKKSSYAGSVRSLKLGEKEKYEPSEEHNSAFYCPVPTQGSPTDLLADRFQAWRKVLKDLITYFRDLHKAYDARSKTLLSSSNVINNTFVPSNFLSTGGLGDAANILRDYHKQSLADCNKARDLENEVVLQLTGLRSDLQQKIKEIKGLSGDFKNSVHKEQEGTKKAVRALQDSLGAIDHDASSTAGRGDPFLVKLGVDRQLERQIEEENYLHRAYLNLEASGRELESIVVGEIQKAYNVLAGILKRDADQSYSAAENLREGPLAIPKDFEWDSFVTTNNQMVDPRQPIRQVSQIAYTGKDHPAAIEVRSGMLERKSKYLKNYTPGWYILSPTHLHEFKSADRIAYQTPVMSLYLPEQKLSSHSDPGSSSHKFMLKGRQTGSMHRGHTWIFRAETYDTMMAWYSAVKELTERRGEDRNEYVRRAHARSFSNNSAKAPSVGSADSGMEEDEADRIAFAGEQSIRGLSTDQTATDATATGAGAEAYAADERQPEADWRSPRPNPGGRFPSDINVQRGLQAPLSPSSESNSTDERDRDAIAAAGALPGSGVPFVGGLQHKHTDLQPGHEQPQTAAPTSYTAGQHPNVVATSSGAAASHSAENRSDYRQWLGPAAAGAGGAAIGAGAAHAYDKNQRQDATSPPEQDAVSELDGGNAQPQPGQSSAPIAVDESTDASAREAVIDNDTAAPSQTLVAAGIPVSDRTAGPATGLDRSSTPVGVSDSVPDNTTEPALTNDTNKSLFDANGVYIGPRTASNSATEYTTLPSRPQAHSAKSAQTISDLHVPGEYPKTPAESSANVTQFSAATYQQ